ncbi:MAG: hypothetical protein FWD58_03355 [Firmicutes bacterium]|nr:hypothetical protein [Bacillota bacterium]
MNKNFSVLRFLPMFLIFAVAFTVIPLMALTAVIAAGEFEPIALIVLVFFAVGAGFWVAIVLLFRNRRIIRRILREGTESTGYFEGTTVGIQINNVNYAKIKFSYNDANGVPHITKSMRIFSPHECEEFRKKSTFKIKYLEGRAVIAEGAAVAPRAANSPGFSRAADAAQTVTAQPLVLADRCYYCGGKFAPDDTQCKGCGASR